jgi:hypothetical protein
VVLTVKIVVAAVVPVMFAEAAEQVGLSAVSAPLGAEVTEQVKLTVPVKAFAGVTVRVDVPVAPCEAIVTLVPARVKLGAAGVPTTRENGAMASMLPEAPFTAAV